MVASSITFPADTAAYGAATVKARDVPVVPAELTVFVRDVL